MNFSIFQFLPTLLNYFCFVLFCFGLFTKPVKLVSLLQKRTRIKRNIPFTITHSQIVSQIQNKSVQINLGNSYFGKLTKKAFLLRYEMKYEKKIVYFDFKKLAFVVKCNSKDIFRIFSNFFFKNFFISYSNHRH